MQQVEWNDVWLAADCVAATFLARYHATCHGTYICTIPIVEEECDDHEISSKRSLAAKWTDECNNM